MESYIKTHTSFAIRIKCDDTKPSVDDYKWLDLHKPFIEVKEDLRRTDQVHCDLILEHFKDQMYKAPLGLMVYDEIEGLWTSECGRHLAIIERYSSKIFVNVNSNDDKKSFMSLYKNAYKLASEKAPILQEFDIGKSKGQLLFNNGVLDLRGFTIKEKHSSYIFMDKIY
eukprot:gene16338-19393_t